MGAACWIDPAAQASALAVSGRILPLLLRDQHELEQQQVAAFSVDGEIIGTGESDFTKGNVEYEFTRGGKVFRLVDVPGIEGDEGRFEECIRAAVAKAHLLFYVNGTNKKPEVETAKKIKKYLNRHAQVLPICNVRGKADSYEFEEDRVALETTHKGAVEAREQTEEVLRGVLGDDCLHEAMSIHGLIGFTALAFTKAGESSISPFCDYDSLTDQRNYIREFINPNAMRQFSQIERLEQFIDERKDSFKEEIVESNKRKIISLLTENVDLLTTYLDEHESITDDVRKEMDLCKKAINARLDENAKRFGKKRKVLCNSFFSTIEEQIFDLVEREFDNKDEIESGAERIMTEEERSFRAAVEELQKERTAELSKDIERLVARLDEDIKRVRFEHELKRVSMNGVSLKSAIDEMKLSGKELGGALFKIGGYTLTGALVGSWIGAGVGLLLGLVSLVFDVFLTKAKKIRKMQRKVGEKIDESRRKFSSKFDAETDMMLMQIRAHIETSIYASLDDEYKKMNEVSAVVRRQLESLDQYRTEIGAYEYGTV